MVLTTTELILITVVSYTNIVVPYRQSLINMKYKDTCEPQFTLSYIVLCI